MPASFAFWFVVALAGLAGGGLANRPVLPVVEEWQMRRQSGVGARSDTVMVLVLTGFPPALVLPGEGPHRLATVDEPGWRALSASLDAAADVAGIGMQLGAAAASFGRPKISSIVAR